MILARPGRGKYLFDALGGKVPVVGIAKTSFARIGLAFCAGRRLTRRLRAGRRR